MDVGVLSRVLKSCSRWRALADHVRNLPERQRTVGRALTPAERKRLFDVAASNPEWEHVYCATVVAANTSMRPMEVKHLRRRDVDLVKKLVYIRRSKNETSHRVIPLNTPAIIAITRMVERADLLGHTEPEHYLWPACQWGRYDATQPMLKWDTAWRALRDTAGLQGLRFHDLRHTIITELAEMGVADHVLESISGHLSRRMLEHYSHIRIDAKRQALDALDVARRDEAGNGNAANGNGEAAKAIEFETVVEVSDDLTSQSRHSLHLAGSPLSAKLLIPFERRDVRVVEGARLESVCRGNSTEGSNPSLSAKLRFARLPERAVFRLRAALAALGANPSLSAIRMQVTLEFPDDFDASAGNSLARALAETNSSTRPVNVPHEQPQAFTRVRRLVPETSASEEISPERRQLEHIADVCGLIGLGMRHEISEKKAHGCVAAQVVGEGHRFFGGNDVVLDAMKKEHGCCRFR